jgi:hypothetical protein
MKTDEVASRALRRRGRGRGESYAKTAVADVTYRDANAWTYQQEPDERREAREGAPRRIRTFAPGSGGQCSIP